MKQVRKLLQGVFRPDTDTLPENDGTCADVHYLVLVGSGYGSARHVFSGSVNHYHPTSVFFSLVLRIKQGSSSLINHGGIMAYTC